MVSLRFQLLLLFISGALPVWACSAFVLQTKNERIIGKNFDWTDGSGYLLVNPRGENKSALPTQSGWIPLEWRSIYGSVTFNQHGKNQPYGGMNEVGLVVEMLWLEQTAYPTSSTSSQFVNELELIQLLLDRCASLADVENQIAQLNIFPIKGKIHYIISDSAGNSALLDFLNGQAYWSKSGVGQCVAMTNNADYYARAYYQRNSKTKKLRTRQSLPRYVLLTNEINRWQKDLNTSTERQAQTMLRKATLLHGKFRTRWSVIYNGQAKTIQFRHDESKSWHAIALHELKFFDNTIAAPLATKKLIFQAYTPEINQAQLATSFPGIGLDKVDAAEISRHQFGQKISQENSYSRNYALLELPLQLEDSAMRVLRFRLYTHRGYSQLKTTAYGDVRMRYSGKIAVWQFPGMPKGDYALVVFQDIDQNKKMNDEPYAFSGNGRLKAKNWPPLENIRLTLNRDFVQYPMHIRR